MLTRLLTALGDRRREATDPSGRGAETGSAASAIVRGGSHAVPAASPEGVVVQVLTEADGCLKQQAIIERTGWGPSKVSRTLTDMEERDLVTRITVGREKVVCLPDAVPDSLRRERGGSTA